MKIFPKHLGLVVGVILLVAVSSLIYVRLGQDEKAQSGANSGPTVKASVSSVVDGNVDSAETDSQDVSASDVASRADHLVLDGEPVPVATNAQRKLPEILKGMPEISSVPFAADAQDDCRDDSISAIDDGVFSGFDHWVERWTAGTADEAEGQALAEQRLSVMQRLMKESPDLAWEQSIPAEVRQRLPASVTMLLEERVDLIGDYLVMVSSFVEIPPDKARTFRSVNQEWTAYSDHDLFHGRTHRNIEIVALAYAQDLSIPSSQNASYPIKLTASPGSIGSKTALVMIVKRPSSTYPITVATAMSRTDEAAAEYAQYSYGQLSITFDVIETAIPESANSFDYEARQVALGLGYNAADYDFELYVSTEVSGAYGYMFDKRTYYSGFPGRYIVHELGHNFGLYHSNWWQPDNGQPPYVKEDGGQMKMYEDKWSVMGYADNADFNIYHKNTLGWLDPSDYLDVGPTSAVFRIYSYEYPGHDLVFDTSGVDGAYYGLRMRKDTLPYNGAYDYNGGERVYWISLPYQPLLSGNQDNEWYQKGVLLHFEPWLNYVNGDPGTAWDNAPYGPTLIDAYPQTTSLTGTREADDAPVRIGDTYIDAGISNVYGNIYITPLRKVDPDGIPRNGDEYVDIKIVTGDQSGNQLPMLSLTPTAWWTRVNESITFSADASDPDGDADLAYLWDFGEGYDASAASRLPTDGSNVQSFAWSSTGTYATVVVVSDGRGGTATQSVDITVIGATAPALSDIVVVGNGLVVLPNDMDIELPDGTHFGVVAVSTTHVFTVTNRSPITTVDLTNSPRITVSDPAGNFTLAQDALAGTLLPGGETLFAIDYTPLSSGSHTAVVSVASTDAEYPEYTFSIGGLSPAVPAVSNVGATATSPTEVSVVGALTAGGAANAWICWGEQDGGVAGTGNWANVISVGEVTELTDFTVSVSPLSTNVTYWFRCLVSNAHGSDWSEAVSMSGRPEGSGWTPESIATLLWLDAMDVNTLLLDGTSVSNWLDKSGNDNHAVQINTSAQPEYDGVNSELTFDGSDIMDVSNDPFNGLQNFAVIALQKWTASSGWGNASVAYHGDSGNGWQTRQRSASYDQFTFTRRGPGNDDPTPSSTVNNSDFIGVGHRYGSQHLLIRHNGSVTYSNASETGAISYSGSNRSSVGGRYQGDNWSSPGNFLSGTMKEVVVIENATTEQIETVEGYLAWKWGLEATLPTNHPYADTAPGGGLRAIGNQAPSGIMEDSATLNAQLDASGTNYDAYVYYGDSDGGTDEGMWESNAFVGSYAGVLTNLGHTVSSLQGGTGYYYAFRATNGGTNIWASPSWQFTTAGGGFTGVTHNITASTVAGGSITPNGVVVVREGSNQTFTVTADTGYTTVDVEIDGSSIGVTNSYTFDNVTTSHTISATFDINQYSVTFDVGTNGTHTGGGALTQLVNYGSSAIAPMVTANTNYVFTGWDSMAFTNVIGSMTVTAQYALDINYTLTYLAGLNGSISGTATQIVAAGGDGTAVTAVPDAGYEFLEWSDSSTANPRTDTSVGSDVTVTANFSVDQVMVVNQGAIALTAISSSLSGELTGGASADAWICWGASDAGTGNTGDWENVVSIGSVAEGTPFSTNIVGLATNTTYFYRCYASSPSSIDWSDVATAFSGTAVGGGGAAVETTLSILEVFCHNEKPNITGYPNDMISGTGMNGNLDNYSGSWPTNDPSLWTATDSGYRSEWQSQGLLDEPTYGKIGWAIFDLGAAHALEDFYIWNERENSGRYTASFNVYVSEIPTIAPTHGPSADTSSIDYDFTSGGWTKINGSALTGSWKGSQVVNIGGIRGRYVAVEILTNGGDSSKVGLAEVGIVASVPQGSAVGNLAPAGITASSTTLNATLNAASTDYDVYVHWGTENGGTNAASWATNTYVGSWTNVSTNLSYSISELIADQTYYYTFMASNSEGVVWASPSWMFVTLPSVTNSGITVNHSVPHTWLDSINVNWSTNYEASVLLDHDGDGFTTWQEYWSGTNPTNANSFLQIGQVERVGNDMRLSWEHVYVDTNQVRICIQVRTNLVQGQWQNLDSVVPTEGNNTWEQPTSTQRFYRLCVTNMP